MQQEYFLPKEIIESVKKSTPNNHFSNKVMHSLQQEERTPLWYYVIYFFAFAFACVLCYIFGGKFSFDIISDAASRFFSFLEFLLKDIRFYIVSTLIFLVTAIGFIRTNMYQYEY
jgi:hypothetical protein